MDDVQAMAYLCETELATENSRSKLFFRVRSKIRYPRDVVVENLLKRLTEGWLVLHEHDQGTGAAVVLQSEERACGAVHGKDGVVMQLPELRSQQEDVFGGEGYRRGDVVRS